MILFLSLSLVFPAQLFGKRGVVFARKSYNDLLLSLYFSESILKIFEDVKKLNNVHCAF